LVLEDRFGVVKGANPASPGTTPEGILARICGTAHRSREAGWR